MMARKRNGTLLAFLSSLLMIPGVVTALELAYCSSQNTGSDFDVVTDRFQSNGACYGTCVAKYAFAVLQGKSCWCSNYIPAAKTPTNSCNQKCPGYPMDKCGSVSDGLFAYIALDEKPSGTATGGSSPSKTTTTLSQTSKTKAPPTTTEPHVSVTTRAGEVVTVTVSGGEPAKTEGSSSEEDDDGASLSGGAIAGIVIGVLVIVGGALGFCLWFFCYRGRREEDEDSFSNPEAHLDPTVPPSALLNGHHRQNRSSQMSMMRNNRLSVPAFTDSRMKKDAVIYGNGARESNISLRDDQDYSRPVLRLANPDP